MAGGTSIGSSPRLDPRPDYTPVRREVLVYTLTELIRYPALCTLTTVATRGVYSQAYAAQTCEQSAHCATLWPRCRGLPSISCGTQLTPCASVHFCVAVKMN